MNLLCKHEDLCSFSDVTQVTQICILEPCICKVTHMEPSVTLLLLVVVLRKTPGKALPLL